MRRKTILAAAVAALALSLGFAGSAAAKPYYYIVNVNSGKALMAENHSKNWGTTIVQENIGGWGAQTWFVEWIGEGPDGWVQRFRNRHSKWCIHPSDWSGLNGTRLLQASCTQAPEAKWYTHYWDHAWRFQSTRTFKFMDVANASLAPGATAVQYDYFGTPSQGWRFIYAGET
jgi:hypothetical protein